MKKQAKHEIKKKRKTKKIVFILIFIITIITTIYIYNKNDNTLNEIVIDKTKITTEKTERMLQVEELKKEKIGRAHV